MSEANVPDIALCLDESIDQLYLICTGIETHMQEEAGGDDHLTRASVINLLRVVNNLNETRKTLG